MNKPAWMLIFFLLSLTPLRAQEGFDVPKSKVVRNIDGTEYYIHTVVKGQTVYKISRTYGISAEELIRLNPEVLDGLRTDMELKIPTGKPAAQKEAPKEKEKAREAVPEPPPVKTAEKPEPQAVMPCGTDPSVKKEVYDVALMMHFFIGDSDTLNLYDLPDDPAQAYRPFQFIQFYEGFLMAVDSLKKTGLSVRLHVYDVSPDTGQTRKFFRDPSLKKMDLMIGLLYHRNFMIAAEFAKENGIPIVSPISERESQVTGNPGVIKVRPSPKVLPDQVAEMIIRQYPDANLVIVRNPQSRFREPADQLQKLCSDAGVKAVVTDSKLMADQLQQEPLNIVAIFSENKSSILDLLTQLNAIKNQYRISVVGLPDWDRIDGLEVDYLVNLKTHVVAPVFIDYDDVNVKRFVLGFQEKYKTDPDVLAFVGFDVADYFLTALMRYGTAFPDCMREMDHNLLATKYHFSRSGNDGFENQHWTVYYFENFRVFDALNE